MAKSILELYLKIVACVPSALGKKKQWKTTDDLTTVLSPPVHFEVLYYYFYYYDTKEQGKHWDKGLCKFNIFLTWRISSGHVFTEIHL